MSEFIVFTSTNVVVGHCMGGGVNISRIWGSGGVGVGMEVYFMTKLFSITLVLPDSLAAAAAATLKILDFLSSYPSSYLP